MITINNPITDALTTDSETYPGNENRLKQDYLLNDIIVGEPFQIDLNSNDFDTYLELIDRDTGEIIKSDYGGYYYRNGQDFYYSNLIFVPQAGINYLARVSSNYGNATGEYSLTLADYTEPYTDINPRDFSAPNTVTLGEEITVSWEVINQGNTSTTDRWYDRLYLSDDESWNSSDILLNSYRVDDSADYGEPDLVIESGLEPGATDTATSVIPATYTWSPEDIIDPGAKYLILETGEYSDDIDPSNNISVLPITFTAPDSLDLDLIPTGFDAPETITAGGDLNISWTVTNQGTNANITSWYDKLYLSEDEQINAGDVLLRDYYDDYDYDSLKVYPWQDLLAAGASYTVDKSFDLDDIPEQVDAGDYYLILSVDAESQSLDKNYNNNTLITPLTITPSDVDLAITDSDIPTMGVIGETIDLSWTVTNQGTDAQHDGFRDKVYVSDDEFLDEADLQLGDFYYSLLYVSEDIYADYYYSEPRPLWSGSSLTAYDSINLTNPDGEELTAGDRYLLIVTDAEDEAIENDETNNVLSVPITLIAPEDRDVDLEITSFTAPDIIEVEPYNYDYYNDNQESKAYDFSWTVNNLGGDTTLTDWTDRIYYSQDAVWDDADLPLSYFYRCYYLDCFYGGSYERNVYRQSTSVAGQTSYTGNLPYTNIENFPLIEGTQIGEGYFILVADADDELAESDESNNTFAVPFTVTDKNNTAPEVVNQIEDLSTISETNWEYGLPSDTFFDSDIDPDDELWGDSLTYHASLNDGSELPAWLSFDAESQTFSGTPGNEDSRTLDIKVTATDLSGAAISDSFSLNFQSPSEAYGDATIHRFYNPNAGLHFYTADEIEKNDIIQNLKHYQYEGESYISVDEVTGEAVHRFYNSQTGVHLYTTSETEKDNIIATLEHFSYEGIGFYAYDTQVAGSIPVYRFYEPNLGVHFYTPNQGEKMYVEEHMSNYDFEGIAYYAFEI